MNASPEAEALVRPRPGRLTLFLCCQLAVLLPLGGWGLLRATQIKAQYALPPLRPEPLVVEPRFDYEVVVTDEQLARVLARLGLEFQGSQTRIGFTDHALRFWTPAARFADPKLMSGEDMRRLLTDQRRFEEVYGRDADPLLIDEGRGVRVRAFEGNTSSSHVDHTLACLAEVGTPLDFPIITSGKQTTFRAIVEQSLRDFSLNQFEYEWSALAYVLLLPPTRSWHTSEGQEVSFDTLAERIMRETLPRGVCSGQHRMHALVMFLRIDDQMAETGEQRILSPPRRSQIIEYLQGITASFVRHQHPDGFWNGAWPTAAPESSTPSDREGDLLRDRIIVTGHVMEWWALAPPEILPERTVLASAGQWLVRTIDSLSPEQLREFSSFLSHAGHALALWRGQDPAEFVAQASVASPAGDRPGPTPEKTP